MSNPSLFAFGYGYVAQAIGRRLADAGWTVVGTRRHEPDETRPVGNIRILAFDITHAPANPPEDLTRARHILVSIPPWRGEDRLAPLLEKWLPSIPKLKWIGYLSSTAVYGDLKGAAAGEDTPPGPLDERGRNRRAAEEAWLRLFREYGVPVHIFRLAGIYGPGRNTLLRLQSGTASRIDAPGHVMSRIHIDDIVEALRRSMDRPQPGRIYNLSDNEAAPQQEVVAYAADLLGVTPPPLMALEDSRLSELARSFYRGCRRIDNSRLKAELGVQLRYPSYREGLTALAAEIGEKPIKD